MQSKMLILVVVVVALGVSFLIGVSAQQPGNPVAVPLGGGQDDTFVPIPHAPEEKSIRLNVNNEPALEWLSGKDVTVRFVSGSGVGRPRLLPVYPIKSVAVIPPKTDPEGRLSLHEVVVDVFDLLRDPTAERILNGELVKDPKLDNLVKVMPEGQKVDVVLSIVEPDNTVVLGRTSFKRAIDTTLHTLKFKIAQSNAGLLEAKDAKLFRVEFQENYLGEFTDVDLKITVTNIQSAFQSFRNRITPKVPNQKIAFVRFGGGAAQENQLDRYLRSETLFDISYNSARVPNREMLDQFFKSIVPAAIKVANEQKLGAQDDEKVLTYIFSNGMTVQGTITEFKKIDEKTRYEMRRNAEDRRTWNRVSDQFRRGGGGGGVSFLGIGVHGSGGSESRDISTDAGSEEGKRFSEDIAELFQSVEGKIPVYAMDIDQLVAAETKAANFVQASMKDFRRGKRMLAHEVSLERLYPTGKLPPGGELLDFFMDGGRKIPRIWTEEGGKKIQVRFYKNSIEFTDVAGNRLGLK